MTAVFLKFVWKNVIYIKQIEAKYSLRWTNDDIGKVNVRYGMSRNKCSNRAFSPEIDSILDCISCSNPGKNHNQNPEYFSKYAIAARYVWEPTNRGLVKKITKDVQAEKDNKQAEAELCQAQVLLI